VPAPPAPDPPDWLALVERLQAGDRLAFLQLARLVSGFLIQLRAYDFRDEWDDLRQEVLASLVANARAGRLRDPTAFVGYVKIITRNKFVDRLKRQLRQPENHALPWDEETARAAALPDPGDPRLAALWSAVEALPEPERSILEAPTARGAAQEVAGRRPAPARSSAVTASLARLRVNFRRGGWLSRSRAARDLPHGWGERRELPRAFERPSGLPGGSARAGHADFRTTTRAARARRR
jgi:DNA-directed RNA polymerase specialized sigma24 family protein